MKCWSFEGPGVYLGAHGVVFADTENEARLLIRQALSMVTQAPDPQEIKITEIDGTDKKAYILFDGDY